jgi:hypothetical protein
VRSLELATRAFQDSLLSRAAKPSHDWHVQPVVKDQNRIPPERRVLVEPAIHSDSVSSKLVHLLRSSPTRRDEPFKLTAAVYNVSTESRKKCIINADSVALCALSFRAQRGISTYLECFASIGVPHSVRNDNRSRMAA